MLPPKRGKAPEERPRKHCWRVQDALLYSKHAGMCPARILAHQHAHFSNKSPPQAHCNLIETLSLRDLKHYVILSPRVYDYIRGCQFLMSPALRTSPNGGTVWDSVHISFGCKGVVFFYPLKPHDYGPSRWGCLSIVGQGEPPYGHWWRT
jgi:hypothetical protein